MKKEFDVVTLGELLIDMFPGKIGVSIGKVESFTPKPGGAPANVAVAVSRLGLNTAFIGKVGEDHFGIYLKGVLDEERVNTRGLCFDPDARTTMAIIAMPDENTAEFVFYRNPGADQCLTIDDLDLGLLKSTKILHICSVSLTDEPARSATYEAVRVARKAGALVSYDVNYRPSLWKDPDRALTEAATMIKEVNLVKVNEEEAALLTGMEYLDPTDQVRVESAALTLLSMGSEIVVITLGAEGSYFQIKNGGAYVPPFKVETIDAVGCGDAFMAGLLTRLVEQDDWKGNNSPDEFYEFLRYANAVGALTSLKRGAIPAMPDRKEVEDFLMKRT
ncbi:MAG: carbohydrate kinase [Chloroflexi bacterium]|nr:carbohydrate kinase [Chloroflexota bacterium]